MITSMPQATAIWNNPGSMLKEWEDSKTKLAQELFVANFTGECGKLADIGCGNGRYAEVMQYTSYIGCDSSYAMIAEAKQRIPDKAFVILDIFKFSSDEVYDTVLMVDVAIHQYEPILAIKTVMANWSAKRYIITLLVSNQHEELLNSMIVSLAELNELCNGLERMYAERVANEHYYWCLLDIRRNT